MWNANQIQGRSIAATAQSSNQVLKWNGSNWATGADNGASYTAGTGLTLTGTSFAANTTTALWNANQLQGRSLAATAPTSGQLLSWDGTSWKPKSINEGYWDTTGATVIHTPKQVGIGTDSPIGQFDVIDTITATGIGANYVTISTQTRGTTGNRSTSVGNWRKLMVKEVMKILEFVQGFLVALMLLMLVPVESVGFLLQIVVPDKTILVFKLFQVLTLQPLFVTILFMRIQEEMELLIWAFLL